MGGKPEKLIVPVIQRVGVNVLAVQGFVPKIIFYQSLPSCTRFP